MSQRSFPDGSERSDNKRARVDSQRPHDQLESINQSYNECELVRYSFLIPLVLTFLNDRAVIGRLLHVCKAMKNRMIGYMLKKQVKLEIAYDLMRQSRYLPVIITQLTGVNCQDLSVFTNLTSVHFDWHHIGAIQLPDTVTDVMLPELWNSPLTGDMWPSKLIRLHLSRHFNQSIEPGMLPCSLTELSLICQDFYWPLLPGAFPSGLVKLTLAFSYDRAITLGVLPDTLEWLQTSTPISCHLPSSLQRLKLTRNGVLDSSFLPNTLTHLSLGAWQLSGPLPSSIVKLGAGMKTDIEGLNTSTTIRHLKLHEVYVEQDEQDEFDESGEEDEEQEVLNLNTCRIPAFVTHLDFSDCSLMMKCGIVPNSVTHLSFRRCRLALESGSIPDSVIDLHLDGCDASLEAGMIPTSVKTLYLQNVMQPLHIGVIPTSVQTLIFGKYWMQKLPHGVIPLSVTKLVFQRRFRPHTPSIPNSVIELQCYWSEDVPVPIGAIPDSVKKLSFGGAYTFGSDSVHGPYSQLLVVGSIPSSVTELDMGPFYNAPIAAGIIPASVQLLKLCSAFKSILPLEWTDSPSCYMADQSPFTR